MRSDATAALEAKKLPMAFSYDDVAPPGSILQSAVQKVPPASISKSHVNERSARLGVAHQSV